MKRLIKTILKEEEFDWVDSVAPRLEIGDPISNPKNKFKFDMEFMHGDADAYTNKTLLIDAEDQDKLNHWLLAIELNQKHGRDGGHNVAYDLYQKGIRPWHLSSYYDPEDYDEEDPDEMIESMAEIIDEEISEYDSSGYDGMAGNAGFKVTYFDKTGLEHKVKINPLTS
jgi:hypothetical protein